MATHNHVRVIGFLKKDPIIINEGEVGAEKIIFSIKTITRPIQGLRENLFQDVMIYYDGIEYMEKMKKLIKFDLVDIQGVINFLNMNKKTKCPVCNKENSKYNGSACYVYPKAFVKLNALATAYEHDQDLPEHILTKYFAENSNECIIVGNVVNTPELIETEMSTCCRYQLGINRKYFIATQSDITADYPWVYSYGNQAIKDYDYLQQGSLILLYGFMRNRKIKNNMICSYCNENYQFYDTAMEIVPYSVEFLKDCKHPILEEDSEE